MSSRYLTPFGGEFRDPAEEAAFQAECLLETLRHTRLLFLLSACLNALFFVSDWRFYGGPHFYPAVTARIAVVFVALLCFWVVRRAKTFPQAQRSMLAWEWVTAAAVAVLVSSHSDVALFAVLMLPSIYYLAVPTSFRWSVVSGGTCSAAVLAGYLAQEPMDASAAGLILAVVMLNLALCLVVIRSNRLQRMEWAATQAERRAKKELGDSRAMFETVFKTVPIPLLVVRMDGAIVETNDAAVRYMGATRQALGIQSAHEFYVDPDDRIAFLAAIQRDGQVSDFEAQVRIADSSVRSVLLSGMVIEIGGLKHIVSSVVDITERKAAEERIWRTASHDPLSGLPNRAYFQSCLEQTLAKAARNGSKVHLLLLDLDHLKSVNERLGHDAGDALIQETAERLRLLVPDGDCISRLGSDEFVVIIEGPSPKDAESLADRLLADLRRPLIYRDNLLQCQVSIGIASYPDHDRQPRTCSRTRIWRFGPPRLWDGTRQ